MRRGGGGMLRCGVWNTAERRRETTKNLERHHLGFLGLQHLEIPQNGQRNVWKSLDKNSLDLEKLAKKLGGAAGRLRSGLYEYCVSVNPMEGLPLRSCDRRQQSFTLRGHPAL